MKQRIRYFCLTLLVMVAGLTSAEDEVENPVAQIDETKYETIADAVVAAKANDVIKIIKAGDYTLPRLPENVTIEGAVDGVVFNHTTNGNIASIPNGATFKNVTFNFGNENYHGFQHAGTINMDGCTLNGKFFSYADMNFTNCTFEQSNEDYHMWVYGGGTVNYTGCTFNGIGKFLNLYQENGNEEHFVNVDNCTFNSSKKNKAALNVKATCGTTLLQYAVNITNCKTNDNFPEASTSDALVVLNGLVQVDDRTADGVDKITVTQNGKKIYPVNYVAQIGETKYETLQAAFAAAPNGETITLLADIDATEQIEVGKQVTLNLNGKTIEYKSETTLSSGVIMVLRGGDLTVTDTSEGATGAIKSGTKAYAAIALTKKGETSTETAKLTVNNGTIEGYYYAIVGNGTRHGTDITIAGGTVKGTKEKSNQGIYHPQDGTLTISGGTISGYSSAVELRSGTLNITGGTLSASCTEFNYQPNQSGTTTAGAVVAIAQHSTQKAINVSIKGATLEGAKTIAVTDAQNNNLKDITVSVADGLTEKAYIPEGFKWVSADGMSTLTKKEYVAQVGDVQYETLQEAIVAATAGQTITLLADIDANEQIEVGKQVTLDLNGKTIEYKSEATLTSGVIMVLRGGDLTVTDTSEGATGAIKSGTKAYAAIALTKKGETSTETAKLTVNNGTIEGYYYAIVGNGTRHGTEITISGGVIKGTADGNQGIYHPQEGTLTINGGTISGYSSAVELRSGTLNITGGTLSASCTEFNYEPNNSGTTTAGAVVAIAQHNTLKAINVSIKGATLEGAKTIAVTDAQNNNLKDITVSVADALTEKAYIPEGFKWVSADGMSTLTKKEYVAQVGDVQYETLQEAIVAATAGQTITLLADIDANEQIEVGKQVTLDLNGKTIEYKSEATLTSGVIMVLRGGDLTVTDTSEGATGAIKSGTKAYAAIALTKKGETSTETAKLTVNNGTIEGYYYAIVGNGTRHGTDITIAGGTVKGTKEKSNQGIYHPQDGTLTISGGTISGYSSAVELRSGTLNITGGTLSASCTDFNYQPNQSGTTTDGAVIAIAQHSTLKAINVSIAGATLDGAKTIAVTDAQNNNLKDITVSVADGLTEKAYIPEGFKWVSADGMSTLKPCVYVAQIGNNKYETLEAAFAAAQDGETITLLADCAGNGIKAPQGTFSQGLTVDFAGHTYTVDGATVGSTGTETNGFQLLKENKITFKGGTITSEKAKILIQNYSDLTLEGMTLTLNNANYTAGYTLSNNNGNVVIDGTTINANPAGGFAFDVCRYSSYPSVNVTVKGKSVINGNVEVFASGSDAKDGFKLMLEAGTMTGNIVLDASAKAAMAATPEKALVTKSNSLDIAAPADYKWVDNGDGTSTLKPDDGEFVLVHGEPYPYPEGRKASKVTYRRSFAEDEMDHYRCWYVPFDYTIQAEDMNNFDFYKIHMIAGSGDTGGEVADKTKVYIYIEKVKDAGTVLRGNRPYVIRPKSAMTDHNHIFTAENITEIYPENNESRLHQETTEFEYDYYGTYREHHATGGYEFISLNKKDQTQWNASEKAKLQSYVWYIKVTSRDENIDYAKTNIFFVDMDDDTTEIFRHQVDSNDVEGVYTVSGAKVEKPVKGVNIIRYKNGTTKKIYVK